VYKPETKFAQLAWLDAAKKIPRPSKFGGTDLERAADNAAAELGYEFDYAQVIIPLEMTGSYTVVDRLKSPRILVYMDGVQHSLRLDAEQQDWIQKIALESMHYTVLRIDYTEMLSDPIEAMRRVLYA